MNGAHIGYEKDDPSETSAEQAPSEQPTADCSRAQASIVLAGSIMADVLRAIRHEIASLD
jgi:hypothetical protein